MRELREKNFGVFLAGSWRGSVSFIKHTMDVVQIAIIIASAAIGFMIGALVFYARTENKIEDAIINAVEERERCIIERDQDRKSVV